MLRLSTVLLLNVVIARLTAQRQKNVRAQIGQCETVGRYESDIARFSVMNEVLMMLIVPDRALPCFGMSISRTLDPSVRSDR
jgi:hypothetical protein